MQATTPNREKENPMNFKKLLPILIGGAAASTESLTKGITTSKHSEQKTEKKQNLTKEDRARKRKRQIQKKSRRRNRK